ncbi:unnamed protein product [Gulo gulo]|uniref:Uncharacterized protein n=1 Tax=Gulo gulo TaxID=48420 RepID=A0A9X9LZ16_GULGU|nr:unnamed protein product [Gulo gulo]
MSDTAGLSQPHSRKPCHLELCRTLRGGEIYMPSKATPTISSPPGPKPGVPCGVAQSLGESALKGRCMHGPSCLQMLAKPALYSAPREPTSAPAVGACHGPRPKPYPWVGFSGFHPQRPGPQALQTGDPCWESPAGLRLLPRRKLSGCEVRETAGDTCMPTLGHPHLHRPLLP